MAIMYQAPKGTKDALPSETARWQQLEEILREVAASFGYKEIRFPTFEHTELFLRSVGDTTDVVNKEMYSFVDKGGRNISLRPEGTASVARAFVEHGLHLEPMPLKVFYIAPNFRYEKPQAGRLREHHQFGVEIFGAPQAAADAEVIALAATYLRRLGIDKNVTLNINSIGCPDCRPLYHAALSAYFAGHRDTLCATCQDRLERNPLRILDCKSSICQKIAADAPKSLDYLCGDCAQHFAQLKGYLCGMDIDFVINPFLVRGLDYYSKTVFEFVSDSIGAQGTVCGGGRYDSLIEHLGGPATSGLGFGSGMERLLLTIEALGVPFGEPQTPDIFIAVLDADADLWAQQLVFTLRQNGLWAERDLCGRSFKAQMKYADKIGAQYTVVIGDNEIEKDVAGVKNMKTGETFEVLISQFVQGFQKLLGEE